MKAAQNEQLNKELADALAAKDRLWDSLGLSESPIGALITSCSILSDVQESNPDLRVRLNMAKRHIVEAARLSAEGKLELTRT